MTNHVFHYVMAHFDHPAVTSALIGAGALPSVAPYGLMSNPLQNLYYLLLIPPAVLHLYVSFKRHCWPTVKKWLKK